ncbi:MAG: FAD-dependent oxidoreductase, partial [Deltaproteobacteria bacterium]
MNETIVDLSKPPRPAEITTEICIVGSGAAGGTAAWELARAGHEVVVVEEGGDFTGFDLTGRDAGMYDQLYMDRGGRATSDLSISVLQGRVLGGGTMINACDVVPFPDGVLRHWTRKFHLTDYSPEALAPFTREALRDLSASRPEETDLNENNRIVRRGAEALGWRGEIMMHNRVGCAGLGICLLGCPLDAKRNTRFVAIPEAMKEGARFFVRARAVRIEDAHKEIKRVHVAALDPKGYHEEASLILRARVVILAANAIASAQLLLRSGIGNDHVGRHLMLQPQLPITAEFDEEVRFFRGIPQTYAVTEFEDLDHPQEGWWGFRIEPISGTPGIVASLLPLMGPEGKRTMTRYPHFAASLLL